MNVTVIQVQLVVIEYPCDKTCRLQPPLDELADRLRREMQHGRECGPIHSHNVADDMASTYDAYNNCN